jgi:hypothetical protein
MKRVISRPNRAYNLWVIRPGTSESAPAPPGTPPTLERASESGSEAGFSESAPGRENKTDFFLRAFFIALINFCALLDSGDRSARRFYL